MWEIACFIQVSIGKMWEIAERNRAFLLGKLRLEDHPTARGCSY